MSKFSNGYALLVGVGHYKHNSLSVPTTAQDAQDLGQTLVDSQLCAYPEEQVTVLTNEDANRTRILVELDALSRRLKGDSNATLIILFSGHGWKEDGYYFLPHETKISHVAGRLNVDLDTALANDDFLSKVRQIPSRRLVILFNTCFAGAVGTALSPTIEQIPSLAPVPLGLYDKLLEGSGRVIISSSQATEKSWIKAGANHSLFVEHLLTGFRGVGIKAHQDTLRVLDLFDHLSTAVSADARTICVIQTPVLKAYDVTQNFPIALLLGGEGLLPDVMEKPAHKMRYNTAAIRKLLAAALVDEELNQLCYDYFPGVYQQLSAGMSKTHKIQRLIEYCDTRNQVPHLLELVKEINPERFIEYEKALAAYA